MRGRDERIGEIIERNRRRLATDGGGGNGSGGSVDGSGRVTRRVDERTRK